MIVEEGIHTLKDGTVVEAGTTVANGKYSRVNYKGKYRNAPVVLTQISTSQKPKVYTCRLKSVTNKQFRVKMQASEKEKVTEKEQIGWVAFGWKRNFKENWLVTRWNRASSKASTLRLNRADNANKYKIFAQVQTEREKDTVNVRYSQMKSKSIKLVLQEETMKDKETKHRYETIGVVALWGKSINRVDLYDDKVMTTRVTKKTLPKFPL
jgi:hypothetical protein